MYKYGTVIGFWLWERLPAAINFVRIPCIDYLDRGYREEAQSK